MGIAQEVTKKALEELKAKRQRGKAYCEIRASRSWCWVIHEYLRKHLHLWNVRNAPEIPAGIMNLKNTAIFKRLLESWNSALFIFVCWTQDTGIVSIHTINIIVDHHYMPVLAFY